MARKQQTPSILPAQKNYTLVTMTVGTLTKAFASGDGPQRDRPQDKASYLRSLRARAKAYGKAEDYNPAVLRPRIVSDRGNGKFWPVDGNGSNHWLESLFGPDFEVPVYLVEGLTRSQENQIFQQVQKNKKVTTAEAFQNDREYDVTTIAYKIEQVLKPLGFHTTNQVKDAWGVGATTSIFIQKRYGDSGLRLTLETLMSLYDDTQWKRTNGAFAKALAIVLHNPDYNRGILVNALIDVTLEDLADNARGSGGESIVLPRIKAAYASYLGSAETTP